MYSFGDDVDALNMLWPLRKIQVCNIRQVAGLFPRPLSRTQQCARKHIHCRSFVHTQITKSFSTQTDWVGIDDNFHFCCGWITTTYYPRTQFYSLYFSLLFFFFFIFLPRKKLLRTPMHTTHTNQPVVYSKARYSTALSSFRIDSTLVTSFLSIRILSLNILFSPTIFMCIPFFRKARRMKKETIDFHFQWPFIHIHWLRCWEHHLPPSTKSFHSLYKRLWFHCLPTPLSLYIFSSILTLDTRINDTHTHHAILLQNHHFYVANFLCIKYRWFFFLPHFCIFSLCFIENTLDPHHATKKSLAFHEHSTHGKRVSAFYSQTLSVDWTFFAAFQHNGKLHPH